MLVKRHNYLQGCVKMEFCTFTHVTCEMTQLMRKLNVGQATCFRAAIHQRCCRGVECMCVSVCDVCTCSVHAFGRRSVCRWHWPWNFYLYAAGQRKGSWCQLGFPFMSAEVTDCRWCLWPASLSTHAPRPGRAGRGPDVKSNDCHMLFYSHVQTDNVSWRVFPALRYTVDLSGDILFCVYSGL